MFTIFGYIINGLFFLMAFLPFPATAGDSLSRLSSSGINPAALNAATRAYHQAEKRGMIHKPFMTLVDFTKPSVQKRLWVINMKTGAVVYNGVVSHGSGSGGLYATRFSNVSGSKASALGAMVTDETYYGKHGLSLRLRGLQRGLNNNIYNRAVVIHSASYATEAFAKKHKALGRSWGCFAISPQSAGYLMNKLKGGSFVYAYAPQVSSLSIS